MTKQLTEMVRCGCSNSCGCGCGEVKAHADSFTRPRFFAGQLLTEEDLGLLEAYVVGKNRLHNRYFYGTGVVCGLEVSCHDCDGGKVNLRPGYGLDCCGNDIVVPCLEELDVIAMIRDLRLSQRGGIDCGDPCAEGEDGKRDGITRHYCLYLHYAEELLEPVAPYATDQSCDGACEPTRTREGYTVELRCGPPDHGDRPDFLTRVLACFGDLRDLGKRIGQIAANQRTTAALLNARRVQLGEARYVFREKEAAQLRKAQNDAADIRFQPDEEPTVDRSFEVLEKARVLRQHVALARSATDEELKSVSLTTADIEAAEGTLHQLVEAAPTSRIVANVPEHERAAARAALRPATADAGGPKAAELHRNMIKAGVPFDAAAQAAYGASLVELRDWLLAAIEKSSVTTACNLHARVAAIKVDLGTDDQEWTTAHARAANELVSALAEYLIDCICAALNPPCPSCDDEGVLLACLDVVDCEVVDICNKARTTVLTSNAIRYWLAPLGWMHEALEQLCCEFELRLAAPAPKPAEPAGPDLDSGEVLFEAQLFQGFVPPSESPVKRIPSELGLDPRTGAGLEQALESLRLTAAATGVSLPEAVGLPAGLATGLTLPPLLGSGLRNAVTAVVAPSVEEELNRRPVDAAAVNAVKTEVVEELKRPESGLATATDITELKQTLNGFKGASTKVRTALGGELSAVKDELERTKEEHAAALERLTAIEQRLEDGGREPQ